MTRQILESIEISVITIQLLYAEKRKLRRPTHSLSSRLSFLGFACFKATMMPIKHAERIGTVIAISNGFALLLPKIVMAASAYATN